MLLVAMGAQFSGAIWWVTTNNSIRRELQACICICSLCENMASCTKSEIHNVLHCCRRGIKPRPHVMCTENFVKFLHVVFEICERTDRQTDPQTHIQTRWSQYFAPLPRCSQLLYHTGDHVYGWCSGQYCVGEKICVNWQRMNLHKNWLEHLPNTK